MAAKSWRLAARQHLAMKAAAAGENGAYGGGGFMPIWRQRMRGIAARQYGESAEERPLAPPLGVAAARQAGAAWRLWRKLAASAMASWRNAMWRLSSAQLAASGAKW
jgi:hypothetical protein